ncbi:hypothetical protein TKK_0016333 [Trichogramma kaykai]
MAQHLSLSRRSSTNSTDNLSEDVLNLLGQRIIEKRNFAPSIHPSIAERWSDIIKYTEGHVSFNGDRWLSLWQGFVRKTKADQAHVLGRTSCGQEIELQCSKKLARPAPAVETEEHLCSCSERAQTINNLPHAEADAVLNEISREQQEQGQRQGELFEETLDVNVSVIAGRLRFFYPNWEALTSDKKILSWIKGVKIPWKPKPYQRYPPGETKFSREETIMVSDKLVELLSKGAIVECSPTENQFISQIFIIPKADKSPRLILNLKKLNEFIETVHFKMENYKTVVHLLDRYMYMTSIDIKGAFYLVPIHEAHRKFLRFKFQGKLYEFTCLVFGINIAPYIFTKLLKPVVSHLRSQGVLSVMYIDDILLLGKSSTVCSQAFNATANLLTKLGFLLNDKCKEIPEQECVYLGFLFNSKDMTLELPVGKREKMLKLISKFSKKHKGSIREYAQFIGSLIACCPALEYSWMHVRNFERSKLTASRNNHDNYEAVVNLTLDPIDLKWWRDNILVGKKDITVKPFDAVIFSDASLTGWGAVLGEKKANGFWTQEERRFHINYLEIKAAFNGLKCFASSLKDCHVLLRIDNTTAIAYINKSGGTQHEHLNDITRQLLHWCEKRTLKIFASYISSKDNFLADAESRKLEPETDKEPHLLWQKLTLDAAILSARS